MIRRVTKLVVSVAVWCLDRLRTAFGTVVGMEPPAPFVVLYYHGIPAAMRGRFARQMDVFSRLCVPVAADWRGEMAPRRRYGAVTFDDAFMSVVANALPELKRRQIPFTIFVPTGSLGSRPSWIRPGHPDESEVVAPPETLRMLAGEDLATIGSHSITHPNFRRLDEATAFDELQRSKVELEEIINKPVDLFSFPHGAYDVRCCELARTAGYSHVFTIDPGLAGLTADRFIIGRVKVDSDDWPLEFFLKASGAYRWMSRASMWKGRLGARYQTSFSHSAT
jgi:peptidoglycan/xylan/chitin deacetylase (PgdA/CDA1 family)